MVSTLDAGGEAHAIKVLPADVRGFLTLMGLPLTLTLSPEGRGDAGDVRPARALDPA
jgi:hypothetical protein